MLRIKENNVLVQLLGSKKAPQYLHYDRVKLIKSGPQLPELNSSKEEEFVKFPEAPANEAAQAKRTLILFNELPSIEIGLEEENTLAPEEKLPERKLPEKLFR